MKSSISPRSTCFASEAEKRSSNDDKADCSTSYCRRNQRMANSRLPNCLGARPLLLLSRVRLQVSAILGTYYYTYSITSLIAGAALDRVGAKKAVPVGIFILAIGCLLFSIPTAAAGYAGRLLQGAGSAFAFTGAVYLAAHGFSARWLATAIGVTQCLGMLGGSAGQFVVGPLLEHGIAWQTIWHWLGTASIAVGILLFVITPRETRPQ